MNLDRIKPCKGYECNKTFFAYRSTDKYCYDCKLDNQKPDKLRKPINRKSKTQKELDRLYLKLRKVFLKKPENKICRVCKKKRSDTVHHKAGRIGKLLLYTPYWLPTCTDCHTWIHGNPKVSYKKGYLIKSTTV